MDRGVSQLPEMPNPLAFARWDGVFFRLGFGFACPESPALDAQSQKLADRYLAILTANPMQQTAFDRLWKIHSQQVKLTR